MAELLVKLESSTDPTNLKTWDRGHVISVQEDGWPWGSSECPPKFCVVKISDMTVEEARVYLESEMEIPEEGRHDMKVLSIRKNKFDLDDVSLPKEKTDELKNTGKMSITKAQVTDCVKKVVIDGK